MTVGRRRCGSLSLSRVAWGMGSHPRPSFGRDDVVRMLEACDRHGVTTIDNAENYGGYRCEAALGEALATRSGWRERFELVTKCGCVGVSPDHPRYTGYGYDTSREHIVKAAELSLRNFRTDRLEALLLHRPDPLMDADEVAEAFTALRAAGKVREFGVSNFLPGQVDLLAARLAFPLAANEIQFSVLHLDPLHDGTLDACQRTRMVPLAWGPLGRGALFGGTGPRVDAVRAALGALPGAADGYGLDAAAIAWLLRHPAGVVPILGTWKPAEMASAVRGVLLEVEREPWYAVYAAATGSPLP